VNLLPDKYSVEALPRPARSFDITRGEIFGTGLQIQVSGVRVRAAAAARIRRGIRASAHRRAANQVQERFIFDRFASP
jgi:hypothetical protein